MPALTGTELKKQVESGNLQSLYVLWGEEKYLVKKAARKLVKKAAGSQFPEFNCNEFTNDSGIDAIADAALALPFMAERKCVAVSDFNLEEKNAAELSKLSELVSGLSESTTLVFYYPTLEFDPKKSAKWRNFLKEAGAVGVTVSFGRRDNADLQKLLMRDAEKAGCAFSRTNASLLIEYVGNDLNALLMEMQKLCAYANGAEITGKMIEELVPKSMETTAFLLANALVAGNYEKAYGCLDLLFYQNEEPIAVLGALSSSFVDMYRVSEALQSGLPGTAPSSYGNYKGKEFRLRNAERNARGLSTEALRKSLDLLLETDLALKGSRLNARIVMDGLVAKLLLAAKGERA